jgi:DNA-binding beta-propeller fold protein YncE
MKKSKITLLLAALVSCLTAALVIWHAPLLQPAASVHAQDLQPPSACDAAVFNPLAVATLRWYSRNQVAQFPIPGGIVSIVFDGSNLYVLTETAAQSGVINKMRASDGASLASFSNFPSFEFASFGSMLFDGQNLWVQYMASDSAGLLKFRASDGTFLGLGGGNGPGGGMGGMTFDGQNIWLGIRGLGLQKISANTLASSIFPGGDPVGLAFDGRNVWVADASGFVTVHRATDGALVHSTPLTGEPWAIAFDGVNMWVTNIGNNTVTKIRVHDYAELGTFPTQSGPMGILFDGANMWIENSNSNSVTLLRACDGMHVGFFATGGVPGAFAFDGINVWVGVNGNLRKM